MGKFIECIVVQKNNMKLFTYAICNFGEISER